MDKSSVIDQFYNAFAQQDASTMNSLYHEDVVFKDPAFGELTGDEAKAMWTMLLQRAQGNLHVTHQNVQVDGDHGSAQWIANYAYGPKKRAVENHVTANFVFKDGKIWRHTDEFDVWKWSRMALGLPGTLLGWTPFLKSKIQKGARAQLTKWMKKNEDI